MKKYYFALVAFCFLSLGFGQIINFPDANFKAKLLEADVNNGIAKNLSQNSLKIDSNNDGEIQITEANQVGILAITQSGIVNMEGIQFFTQIFKLYCQLNQISNLVVTSLPNLAELYCYNNNLTTLNLSGLASLQRLECNFNQLTNLNLTGCTSLSTISIANNNLTTLNFPAPHPILGYSFWYIDCSNNQIAALNINNFIFLQNLYCNNNSLNSLLITNCLALSDLNCSFNQLLELNTLNLPGLNILKCNNNLLTELNVNNNTGLNFLNCSNNQLQFLQIKNGRNIFTRTINGNANLRYICCDNENILNNQNNNTQNGYPSGTIEVNSYCTFNPGGFVYKIQGISKFDATNDGCTLTDTNYTNLKFNFINGNINGTVVSNNSGNYSIPVQAGTHTITPILQNPSYFNVSPASTIVTFPATASPAIRDFCITPNGNHQDVEVVIIPISAARPGFDSFYKIIFTNKGNIAVSGNIAFSFSDAETDFVSAIPNISSQNGGTLYWDYVNLLPFEKREITVVLNLNSPQENPALIGGDKINFEAIIEPITNDETSGDNIFEMQQTVVNSYDPNDKTCLEGNNIVPAKVGDYVHYMIRFENTGTFPAENIVVKDIIDTTKFEIASLLPINGSHDFETRITGDKVEFIFQNINLPFDNANNDGYVAFKIKTKSTLVLGNTFSNVANIYFDYNFPIVTNTATTTVANLLVKQDFVFNEYVNIYPNPAQNILNINNLKNIAISSISIYNVAGQVLQVITNPSKTIDVTDLKTGNYFLKIVLDNGISSSKFIKQ